MKDIVKEFPGVRALAGVSFDVRKGEVHALCGENGAGKSTLMKVLSGFYPHPSYQGEIRLGGEGVRFGSTRESERAGIAIIYQELSLVPEMTVAENIFLGVERARAGIIRRAESLSEAQRLLARVGLRGVRADQPVRQLGIGQQQLVEIAKALSRRPRLLVLDEPTSALTGSEVAILMGVLRTLRAEGVSSILISHKLGEVAEIADRVTVLRDGRTIATYPMAEASENRIIADMVGREVSQLYPRTRPAVAPGTVAALELRDWTVAHPTRAGRFALKDVALRVRPGEIVGIAGLMGSGRSELLLSLFGAYAGARVSGELRIGGEVRRLRTPAEAWAAGIALVTEDRKRLGLVLEDSVARNVTLSSLRSISRAGVVDTVAEFAAAEDFRRRLRIKTASLTTQVRNLSGGNQQKVVLSKCLMTRPRILLLDEPTRGIDVGARAEIYQLIDHLAAEGMAIVVVSSELPEVLGLADQVLVFSEGRVAAELAIAEATQERVMHAAALGKRSVH